MAAALALPVAGCGKAKPKIPSTDAQHMIALLRQADARAVANACRGLQATTLPDLQVAVEQLPAKTDPDIRNTLRDGIANLRTLVTAQCATQTPKPTPTTPSTTAPPPSTTAPPTTNTAPPTTNTNTNTTPNTNTNTTPNPNTNTTPSGGSPSGKAKKAKKNK